MKSQKLLSQFSTAIQWNSIFYVLYKICYVALSFTLYKTLSPSLFSTWATGNSLVFLALLWLDCGFRKSIPRYSPEFAFTKKTHRDFIYSVLLVQIGVLLISLLPFRAVLYYFVTFKKLIYYILGLFVISGISELFRIIYHAHFWQKQFNKLQMFWVLLEVITNFFIIFTFAPNEELIAWLFTTKIASSCGIIGGSLLMIPSLLQEHTYTTKNKNVHKRLSREFIEHSVVMWATTCIKSLSERNFLFPFLTATIGTFDANLFKVAHDGALFFQRIALRILSATDTTLLAYIQVYDNRQKLFQKAFTSLLKTVAALSVPLLYIGILVFVKKNHHLDSKMLSIFFVVAIGYMLEVFLSPYERMLEIKRRYKLLWISYTPYLLGFGYLLISQAPKYMSLFGFIALVHGLRLIGSLSMTYFSEKYYPMPFPKCFIALMLSFGGIISLMAWLLL